MISVAPKTLKKGLLIDTELPKERIYYKRQGKFIHLMWAPTATAFLEQMIQKKLFA